MKTGSEHIDWQRKLRELSVLVVIPTYNNAGTLGEVIEAVCRYASDVLVVNDGCTDATHDVLARYPQVRVLAHQCNRGKGTALRNGLRYAQEAGFRYAITIDADGQHFASDIPVFIETIERHPGALLVGARNLTADNMPGRNTFANRFSNFWYRIETGRRLTDTQSGFRLYPLDSMGRMTGYTARYEFELEVLVFSAWRGVKVMNVPVHVYYPPEEERVSHFRPGYDFARISLLNTVLVIIALLWYYPVHLLSYLRPRRLKYFYVRYISGAKESNTRLTLSVMFGVFMGIVPIWGYQMLAAVFLAHCFRLNKMVVLLAANISLPPFIPFLLYGSYVTGCRVLNEPVSINMTNISLDALRQALLPYIVGSFIFAAMCSLTFGLLTGLLLKLFRNKR